MKLDIDLTPAQATRLREEAERLKITPEELARAAVTDLLSERDNDFKIAAERLLEKYRELYRRTGGASGIRDLGALESAIARPKSTFDSNDLYPSIIEKAAVLCFSIGEGVLCY
jgi:hypothetical protein